MQLNNFSIKKKKGGGKEARSDFSLGQEWPLLTTGEHTQLIFAERKKLGVEEQPLSFRGTHRTPCVHKESPGTSLMSSDAFFLPSISTVPGTTQATPRMKFRSDRYRFCKEESKQIRRKKQNQRPAGSVGSRAPATPVSPDDAELLGRCPPAKVEPQEGRKEFCSPLSQSGYHREARWVFTLMWVIKNKCWTGVWF